MSLLTPVLRIRIQFGSVISNFVDPDSYSEYGSGSILVKKGKLEAKITIQTFKDKTDKKYLPV